MLQTLPRAACNTSTADSLFNLGRSTHSQGQPAPISRYKEAPGIEFGGSLGLGGFVHANPKP